MPPSADAPYLPGGPVGAVEPRRIRAVVQGEAPSAILGPRHSPVDWQLGMTSSAGGSPQVILRHGAFPPLHNMKPQRGLHELQFLLSHNSHSRVADGCIKIATPEPRRNRTGPNTVEVAAATHISPPDQQKTMRVGTSTYESVLKVALAS